MKIRTVITICCLGICISAFAYIMGQVRSDGVFADDLDVNALQRKVESGESFLVYFYGRSCEDCAASEPYLVEALANATHMTAYKCERDANATVRSLYGVEQTPTLIYFVQGQEAARLVGPLSSVDEYSEFLRGINAWEIC